MNSALIVKEDALPAKKPAQQIVKVKRRPVHPEVIDLRSSRIECGLSTKEPIPQEESEKGDCQSKTTRKATRHLRFPKSTETASISYPDIYLDPETLKYLSPLTDIAGVSSEVKAMDQWYHEWTILCDMTKIAEGSYGSVFRLSDREGVQEATIGKLMPLKAKSGKGSRKVGSTHVSDVASEILLLEKMSHVPGFVEFRSVDILVGGLPKALKKEYRTYEKRRKDKNSSSCSPSELSYPDTQLWVFIEMGDAGTELEDALCPNTQENRLVRVDARGQAVLTVQQARDVFWGAAEALACGEEAHEFEHRDLHFSNICIKERDGMSKGYQLIPKETKIEVTLIDYTLSRTTLSNGTIVSNRMADEEIFKAEGDLQFEVYRWMRDAMPGANTKYKDWEAFVPSTNALWLYHLLAKLLQQTPRPVQHPEMALWDLLDILRSDINPEDESKRIIHSAGDVANYARQGRNSYLNAIAKNAELEKGDVSQFVKATQRMRIR